MTVRHSRAQQKTKTLGPPHLSPIPQDPHPPLPGLHHHPLPEDREYYPLPLHNHIDRGAVPGPGFLRGEGGGGASHIV